MKIRVATRRSNLALTQTRWFTDALRARHPEIEIEEIPVETKGDRVTDRPLAAIGGKGLFVSEVEAYVARGEADIAIHSLKDVPGDVELAEGLGLVCLPVREDPRDVFITPDGSDLMDLPAGARVGTTSLRRAAQLGSHRPDLAYQTLRGNVETRLSRLDEGRFDAIVLAAAGMSRLGLLEKRAHVILEPSTCLPAVGQGTLGIEARLEDEALVALLQDLEDPETRVVTSAERALLKRLKGSCRVPMAGFARLVDGGARLRLDAMVASVDGQEVLSASAEGYLEARDPAARNAEAATVGIRVANELIERGAERLMREAEAAVQRREKLSN